MTVRIHPTAIVEDAVTLGDGTAVWDNVHIRRGTTLGDECIVGGKYFWNDRPIPILVCDP